MSHGRTLKSETIVVEKHYLTLKVLQKKLAVAPLAKLPSLAATNDQRHLDNQELHTGPYGIHAIIIKVYKKGQYCVARILIPVTFSYRRLQTQL